MSLRSIEKLFSKRPLIRCFLHNDHLSGGYIVKFILLIYSNLLFDWYSANTHNINVTTSKINNHIKAHYF